MTWLLIAALAQFILGTSAVLDKLLLRRGFFNPLAYTFWIGVLGLFSVVVVIPFGFEAVSFNVVLLSFIAGTLFMAALLCLFISLHGREASETLPVIGSLSPIFTLLGGLLFLSDRLALVDFVGFVHSHNVVSGHT